MGYFKTALLLLTAAALNSTAQTTKFTINGNLSGMTPMPAKIYLAYGMAMDNRIDSATVNNGKYTFSGSLDACYLVTLNIAKDSKQGPGQLNIMLDNGTLNVESEGTLKNATVSGSGSATHNEYKQVTSFAINESAAIQKLIESEEYKTNETLRKEVEKRSTNLFGNAMVNMIKYVRENPNSKASPYFTYVLIGSQFLTPQMSDTLNQIFPPSLRSTKIGRALDSILNAGKVALAEAEATKKALENKVPVGAKAIDFTQNDVNGKPVSLSSFKGQYVLIDFWASWCAPCRAENPNVVKAYQTYKNKNFTILGVSLDSPKGKQAWLDAIKKDGLEWVQVSDLKAFDNEAAKLYGVQAIPQNFLIDPHGVIVAKNLRGEELQKKLASILNPAKP